MSFSLLSRRAILARFAGLAGLAILAGPLSPDVARAAEPIRVVASFSILGDLVRQVGGDRVAVTTLVGPEGDAHVFQPSPSDAKALAGAKVAVLNGLAFDRWMERLAASSGFKGVTIVASKGVKAAKAGAEPDGHGHSHDVDPHAWQSLANGRIYVANIRDGLVAADPEGRSLYEANAIRYLAEIDQVETEVKAAIAAIPPERRKIVTTHDAFGYFGRAYGLSFMAPEGVSTESEASARDVARIIRQVKADKVPAVFLENVTNPRLLDQIAKESGAKIGGTLYSDALSGPSGPAATYLDMWRHNIRTIGAALAR